MHQTPQNPKPNTPKPQNPKPQNPKTLNPKTLNPETFQGARIEEAALPVSLEVDHAAEEVARVVGKPRGFRAFRALGLLGL